MCNQITTMFKKLTLLAAMLAMVPLSAKAHMIMANPVPYNHPNNSPLDPSGSDFPCKALPYTIVTMNDWKVGSTQKLSFTGTAVHGGGSCQLSVTTDKEPTKSSKFKVIYSIEGGCPANVDGNLDERGPSYDGSFPFTVPPELPNGQMTVAWTWFNKIGNREMYMNCAPITVSGGATDTKAFDALPDMAVANIAGVSAKSAGASGSCTTTETSDYTFPNPGKYKTTVGKGPFVDLCSGKAVQPPTANGGGSGSGSGSGDASGPAAAAPVSSQVPNSSTLRTIFTVTAPMPPLPSATQDTTPPFPANVTSAPAPALAPTGQSPQPSAAPLPSGTACPTNGAVVCSPDGTQFGICNFGNAVMMPVASGTKCVNGAIARRAAYKHQNMRDAA